MGQASYPMWWTLGYLLCRYCCYYLLLQMRGDQPTRQEQISHHTPIQIPMYLEIYKLIAKNKRTLIFAHDMLMSWKYGKETVGK